MTIRESFMKKYFRYNMRITSPYNDNLTGSETVFESFEMYNYKGIILCMVFDMYTEYSYTLYPHQDGG